MDAKRQQLHSLIDALPDDSLQRAEQALKYCANPGERLLTIEQAKKRVSAMSIVSLEEHAKRTGGCAIGGSIGHGMTMADGEYRWDQSAWDDGPITYHLRVFSGYMFEIYERLELAKDGTNLVLTHRIFGPNGVEQRLTANIPVS